MNRIHVETQNQAADALAYGYDEVIVWKPLVLDGRGKVMRGNLHQALVFMKNVEIREAPITAFAVKGPEGLKRQRTWWRPLPDDPMDSAPAS